MEVALGVFLSWGDGHITGCSLAQVAMYAQTYTTEIEIEILSDPWDLFISMNMLFW